jgi:hypothetical protein
LTSRKRIGKVTPRLTAPKNTGAQALFEVIPMNQYAMRAEQICEEIATKAVSRERLKQLNAELDELESAEKTRRKAVGMSSYSDSDQYAPPGMPTLKSVGGLGKSHPKWQPPSPLHASHTELKQLYDAACHRAGGFQIEVKALGADSDIHTKAAGPITESGGGFTLPSQIVPGLQMRLPYEPARRGALNHIETAAG